MRHDDIDTIEDESGCVARIVADDDCGSDSPRDWCNVATLLLQHRRRSWPWEDDSLDKDDSLDELRAAILAAHPGAIICTVQAYEHGGVILRASESMIGPSDGFDSGIAGLAYVTAEQLQTEWMAYGQSAEEARNHALKCIAGEIDTYSQWCNGDVYGIVIEDPTGETLDSCWGSYGHDESRREAQWMLDEAVADFRAGYGRRIAAALASTAENAAKFAEITV